MESFLADIVMGIIVWYLGVSTWWIWIRTIVHLPDCFSTGILHPTKLTMIQVRLTGSMESLLARSPHLYQDIARQASTYPPSAILIPYSSLNLIIYSNQALILDTVLI